MTPASIDRVFGRGRLRMVTGDHVEVFREESQPGERRRYTKRFLATPAGDFRQWTEREWRILARLVGHGIGPVPDVVQFDRGASGRQALVQTYDAGVTIDHWTTLLPVQRDGETRAHVFEDCAHWWALARHSLVALDAIHDLHLVHLDLKADNVCIPVGPVDFDPEDPGARLFPDFERIALIDFAFSLVSGERLDSALPIARQTEFDYQSPRLLAALEEGSRGNLWPTRLLDWRCDLFSLAAMLRRYLPEPERDDACGWTVARRGQARALVRRLLEAHDAELPAVRPHAELIAVTDDELRDPELADSLQRGWLLGERSPGAIDDSPTPVTRIALPLALASSPLRFVDSGEVISIDPSDVEGWAAANPPPPQARPRRRAWVVGLAGLATAAAAVPLLGEAWRSWAEPGVAPTAVAAPPALRETERVALARVDTGNDTKPAERESSARPAPARPTARAEPAPAEASPARAASPAEPSIAASGARATPTLAASSAPGTSAAAPETAATNAGPPVVGAADTAAKPVESAARRPASPSQRRVAAAKPPPPVVRTVAAPPPARNGEPVAVRPAAFPATAKASPRPAGRSPIYLPPAVGLAPLPGRTPDSAAAPLAVAAASPAATPAPAAPSIDDGAVAAPADFMQRGNDLLAVQIPRIAQRAERMVLRVLVAAAHADEDGSTDDQVRLAAGAIRLAPDDPQLTRTAVRESRQFHEGARIALRRGDFAEAVGLETRAFGANPVDAEIVGTLAYMRLRQSPSQPEAARRLALHALTLHDWKFPSGRIEDWNTFAIASALTGHERDARNAWLVALALAGGSERQCRAAIDAYALYGEALRLPVEAMLYRANAAGRSPRSRLCEWPPHWSASVR